MSERVAKLKDAVEARHKCAAIHAGSEAVVELFRDEIAWDGVVETFILKGHPRANRCCAWWYFQDGKTNYTTVLGIPPAESPHSAVRVAIAAKGRQE